MPLLTTPYRARPDEPGDWPRSCQRGRSSAVGWTLWPAVLAFLVSVSALLLSAVPLS